MADSSGNCFYLVDMGGRDLYRSGDLNAFIGISEPTFRWQQAIHPEDLGCARTLFTDATRSQQSFAGWLRLRRADGLYVWSLASGMPFVSEINNVAIGVLGAICPMPDARGFSKAGGLLGPQNGDDRGKSGVSEGATIETIADLVLSANAMAREIGEVELATHLEAVLMRIGFKLADRLKNPIDAHANGHCSIRQKGKVDVRGGRRPARRGASVDTPRQSRKGPPPSP